MDASKDKSTSVSDLAQNPVSEGSTQNKNGTTIVEEVFQLEKFDRFTRKWKSAGLVSCQDPTVSYDGLFDPNIEEHLEKGSWVIDFSQVGICPSGWTYAYDFPTLNKMGVGFNMMKWNSFVRRRKWLVVKKRQQSETLCGSGTSERSKGKLGYVPRSKAYSKPESMSGGRVSAEMTYEISEFYEHQFWNGKVWTWAGSVSSFASSLDCSGIVNVQTILSRDQSSRDGLWKIDGISGTDSEGWTYSSDLESLPAMSGKSTMNYTGHYRWRRRLWKFQNESRRPLPTITIPQSDRITNHESFDKNDAIAVVWMHKQYRHSETELTPPNIPACEIEVSELLEESIVTRNSDGKERYRQIKYYSLPLQRLMPDEFLFLPDQWLLDETFPTVSEVLQSSEGKGVEEAGKAASLQKNSNMTTTSIAKRRWLKKKYLHYFSQRLLDLRKQQQARQSSQQSQSMPLQAEGSVAVATTVNRSIFSRLFRKNQQSSPLSTELAPTDLAANSNNLHRLEVSMKGVVLSYLPQLIRDFGGEIAVEGLTTGEVCARFIKPLTLSRRCSFCQYLEQKRPDMIRPATVFVSHAWSNLFLENMAALQKDCEEKGESLDSVVIWFDLFSNNQHQAQLLDQDWWLECFWTVVRQVGRTVMILSPWNQPLTLTRYWCLFEIFSTLKNHGDFRVIFPPQEREKFRQETISRQHFITSFGGKSTLERVIAAIDIREAQASNPEDKALLSKIIRHFSSTEEVNRLIQTALYNLHSRVMEEVLDQLLQLKLTNDLKG